MLYDTAPEFSRLDYQGFVRDLSQLAGKAQGVLEKVREVSANTPQVAAARAALPRPARFKGRNAPSARRMAWLTAATRATPEELVRLLKNWTDDRFNPEKYQAMLCAAEPGESGLATAIRSLAWNDDRLFLEHLPGSGCWTFGLSESEVEFAASAMKWVRSLTHNAQLAIQGIAAARHFERLAKWFFFNRKDVNRTVLPRIESVFDRVQQAVMPGTDTVILCKADTRLAGGRAAEAYVRPAPTAQGAMIFLGDAFFRPPVQGYDGTQRQLYRAATLVHELTHLFADTEDVAGDNSYGRVKCSELSPEQQLKNADNYGLFAFEVSRSMVFDAGTALRPDIAFVFKEYGV